MFDFDKLVDRHGSWCTQWDYVSDRFGHADLLPFTISDMDFATAPVIIEALQQRITHGVFGYSRWKNDDFLSAIADWYQQCFQQNIEQHQLVYGPSVIYMVAQMIRQWSEPGDSVLIHTPSYDAFYKTIIGNQRQVLAAPLIKQGNLWHCDMQALEQLLARGNCKIMLLCSPHNPTGKVWLRHELEQMSELCARHQVRVISDEIHMDMIMGDVSHTPWMVVASQPYALFTSASKSFNIPALTGAYGFISDTEDRNHWFAALKEADGLSSPAVMAIAAHIAAYRHGHQWLEALRRYLKNNLQYVAEQLNSRFPEINWSPPQASYLAWIDLRPLKLDTRRLQEILIDQQKIAIMPGEVYGPEGEGFLRFNVGCPRSKLQQGVGRLIKAIETGLGEK